MPREDEPTIPSFAASRDEAITSAPRNAPPPRGSRPAAARAGMGAGARLLLTVSLVVAAVACAWAWQLQQIADSAVADQTALQQRVADLEALLSDTDESVNQSAAALGAQLRVVDKETRRLEQRRRELDARIDKLEKTSGTANSQRASLQQLTAENQQAIASLKKTAGDLQRIATAANSAQQDIERMADGLNRSNLEQAAIAKRVAANEEWIASINAFRRQVNTRITQLEQSIRSAPASP